jgi:hypothetical protein
MPLIPRRTATIGPGADREDRGDDDQRADRGHLLVLDLEGSLCATVHVVIDSGIEQARARLQLLIMDAALGPAGREVEERMIGVALALCEAYGCADVDLVATPASASSART